MACYEAEQAVAAFFHANRAMRKRKPLPGNPEIWERARERVLTDWKAERHAWELASER